MLFLQRFPTFHFTVVSAQQLMMLCRPAVVGVWFLTEVAFCVRRCVVVSICHFFVILFILFCLEALTSFCLFMSNLFCNMTKFSST